MSKRRRRIILEDDEDDQKCEPSKTARRQHPRAETDNTSSNITVSTYQADKGHRYGNFHNYYSFNPPSNRLAVIQDHLKYIAQHNRSNNQFTYCDVGCNEGDLTMQVASTLESKVGKDTTISVTGVDLDNELIQRAKQKFGGSGDQHTKFVTANVCNLQELETRIPNDLTLLSLFSTTMWLHIHVGDDGFRTILEKLCHKIKKFFLIEPQSSKSYRTAAARLRKQGLDPLDISTERLKVRTRMEEEISKILTAQGFQKVVFSSNPRTKWDRSLQLYERIETTVRKDGNM